MENNYYAVSERRDLSALLTNVMSRVYVCMFIGLLVTAAAAYWASSSETFMWMIFTDQKLFWGLIIAELVLVLVFSATVRKMSVAVSFICFIAYSLINGLTLSVVLWVYTEASVFSAFLVACLTFGLMSVIGHFTKKDLTSVGHYCMMGLIGVVLAGIINIFIMNDVFSFLVSAIGLLVFIGLTAYDTQTIKRWLAQETNAGNIRKITVWGALTLYLDFINIFLKLLRLTGKRRN